MIISNDSRTSTTSFVHNVSNVSPGDGDVNSVGSSQKHALQTHTHKYDKPTQGLTVSCESPTGIVAADISADTGAPSIPSQQLSTNETRPVNTFVYWLIKTRLDS